MLKTRNRGNVRILSILMAFVISGTSPSFVYALDDVAENLVSSAVTLADQDLEGNTDSIRILLQNCVNLLEDGDPVKGTLQSVLTLLDSGTANAQAIIVLLRSVANHAPAGNAESEDASAIQGSSVQEKAADENPEEVIPAGDISGKENPVQETPVQESPVQEIPVEEPPVQESPVQEPPVQEPPAEEPPVQENPVQETPVEEPPVQETPIQENPVQEIPVQDLPVQEPPVEEPPVQETPIQESPVQENPVQGTTVQGRPQEENFGNLELEPSELGLPVYEAASYIKHVFQEEMLVDVPQNWGNNASGRALTSYSPVNASGAISPSAGTLTISYFPAEGKDQKEAFDNYTKNIAGMSVTTYLAYEDAVAADLPARKLDFSMSVGANQFLCQTVCFAYEKTIYAIELMQGLQSEYDYFPVYHRILKTAEIGDEERVAEVKRSQEHPTVTPPPAAEATPVPSPVPAIEATPTPSPVPEEKPDWNAEDMGTFQYMINGHTYQFPTAVQDISQEDLPLDFQAVIPYDFHSDADMVGGSWTEIVNTQYYYFENTLFKEMAGVTNMSGRPAGASECMLTALIDTGGDSIDIALPGNIRIWGNESDIYNAFPEFRGRELNGLAGFRGNELLYACNVRDDGCHGYVLIRNDAPYYSAVSIICTGGRIIEISFECLGSERAKGVFL